MTSIISRVSLLSARRGLQYASVRSMADKRLTPDLEHATGLEKMEMLAKAAGNDDPYNMQVFKRIGDKGTPTSVPSFYQDRIIGCICEEDATCINWMWLSKGETKRCECGYSFNLVDAKPVV